MTMFLGEPIGQSWLQVAELGLAFVLSALIGLEREIRQKSAGLRTYTLVGFASALIILISKYGFTDILRENLVVLDPSRIAAQIVSDIGSWHGLRRRAADSRDCCHRRPFRSDRAISGDRATPAKISLGSDIPSD